MDLRFDLMKVKPQGKPSTFQYRNNLDILKMNMFELNRYIEEQLQMIPVLEITDVGETPGGVWYTGVESNLKGESTVNVEKNEYEDYYDQQSDHDSLIPDNSSQVTSLKDYLLFQLHTSKLSQKTMNTGEYIINNIDENGYLKADIHEISAHMGVPLYDVNSVLHHIQTFDPPGVGARNLKECILLQLKRKNGINRDIIKAVEQNLDDMAFKRIAAVSRNTGLDLDSVSNILEFIKTLEPKPGRPFAKQSHTKYIIPDIIIRKVKSKNKYEVIINDDIIPYLGIDLYYSDMLKRDIDKNTRKFIESSIDNALVLIRIIEDRKNILKSIGEYIVEKQMEFLERGKLYIKPTALKYASAEMNLPQAAVFSVLNDKYIECPWGVFEMKTFFKGKCLQSAPSRYCQRIKKRIRELIENEDKNSPFTDRHIACILTCQGLNISAGTVARYRAEMNYKCSYRRKLGRS